MTDFDITELTGARASVLHLYSIRKSIWIDPPYQRMGDIWPLAKKQLLIDSLINGFDLPKFYFHDVVNYKDKPVKSYRYSVIDGRQRLEAIWAFIEGKFPLSDDFEYLLDNSVRAAKLTYQELAERHPTIKQLFDANNLSVFVVNTDDLDLIEDMFSRLNEAVPLNAAEKRNAFGGPLPKIIREVAEHPFFRRKVKISNRRYQHRDIAAKLLWAEFNNDVVDTKKVYLDEFVRSHKGSRLSNFASLKQDTVKVLDFLSKVFTIQDSLLRSSGMVVVYYALARHCMLTSQEQKFTRTKLINFEKARAKNRKIAEEDIAKANYELLEFDRLMQTPNDAYAIERRQKTLGNFLKVHWTSE